MPLREILTNLSIWTDAHAAGGSAVRHARHRAAIQIKSGGVASKVISIAKARQFNMRNDCLSKEHSIQF